MRLDGKTAIVTGASTGLGRVMADAFLSDGANVTYGCHYDDELEPLRGELGQSNNESDFLVHKADVRDWEDVQYLERRTREEFGHIDIVVNNAGVSQEKVNYDYTNRNVEEVPIRSWNTIFNTNLRGAFLCSKAVLPHMRDRGTGSLIHISSGHGVKGRAKRAPYVASKYGLEGFHDSLALELEGSGVRSVIYRPPDGGVFTEKKPLFGREKGSYTHGDSSVVGEPAVQIAAGGGENGGRYKATDDGQDFEVYTRAGEGINF